MHFTADHYAFLRDLRDNNDRDWFKAHKKDYERQVKEPALAFIRDFAPRLEQLTPHLRAIPKVAGGSLFRIYRDTRFSKDKTPYKTHTGIHFNHEMCKDVHAPGFYLHLAPGEVFIGGGIWRPDSATLFKLREAIVAHPARWAALKHDLSAGDGGFGLTGDSLKRPPRDFAKDHEFVEDLKRKDFIASTILDEAITLDDGFIGRFEQLCRQISPLNEWLCDALELPY
jgi:uncharacterized protein (TIGR02453 family)